MFISIQLSVNCVCAELKSAKRRYADEQIYTEQKMAPRAPNESCRNNPDEEANKLVRQETSIASSENLSHRDKDGSESLWAYSITEIYGTREGTIPGKKNSFWAIEDQE